MIHHDLLRQVLLAGTALIFCAFALWALLRPASLGQVLGYAMAPPNGPSEFGAIYVGVFTGMALLCLLALTRVHDAVLGDLCAVFLLLQPAGRLVPLWRHGPPQGWLRAIVAMEVIGAAGLLLVRPAAGLATAW